MNRKKYDGLLENHDWFWQMSDSPAVRDRGLINETKLRRIAEQRPSYKKSFQDKLDKMINASKKTPS